MKHFLKLFLLSVPLATTAQNPIISGQFTADPTARVFNNKVYLYPSHDIYAPEGVRQDWFCMADYHVFSSEDLVNWHDHGIIGTQEEIPWVNPKGYSMWAPDCVEKDGKYYFYFPAGPKTGRGFGVGVAVADKPEGPFTFEAEPIKGIFGIDPCVLIDDDGKSYIYWGGVSGAPLKDNMKELADKGQRMEGLPEGFKEGPFAFKKDGHYYLTFPWVREEGGTEALAYCMSDKPLGPWEYKGIIMKESPTGCWTNHHSIVQYQEEWYLFYHHNDYSPNFDKRRSARIDRLYFNADGTIREVIPTLRGVGINQANSRIDVDRYSKASKEVELAYLDTTNTFRGWEVKLPKKGSWLTYADVDFSTISERAYLTANVKADKNTRIVIREKSKGGKVIARINVQVETDGQRRRNYSGQWFAVTAPLTYIPKGVTDLYIA
ncbi:MAG: family 43 glycosylhydrolase, partial [Bacteroidaceae bacterium]|nr:family 43 glycosylhydrolase [Bacteroidaceae bacterium]